MSQSLDERLQEWGVSTIRGWLDIARHAAALRMLPGSSWPSDWSMEDCLVVAWLLEDWDVFADLGCYTEREAWGRLCWEMGWNAEGAANMWPVMEELRNDV